MWAIRRTKPLGVRPGFAIPVFIKNLEYHLTTVDAYSDGAIDVWGFVDRALFAGKLRSGWVWSQPPDGGVISVFNLGRCVCQHAEWHRSTRDIGEAVEQAIRTHNPEMRDLLDMEGSDTEMRGKVRWAKLSLADDHPVRRGGDGSEIAGREVPAFAKSGTKWRLTRVFIFANGTARVGADGDFTTVDAIYRAFDSGELATSVTDRTPVEVEGLGTFVSTQGAWFVAPSERVKEIRDLVSQLAGNPDAVKVCREALQTYESSPSEVNRSRLRAAYEAVPQHLRIFCGDMDSKDWPIKNILYGGADPTAP